MDIFAAIGSIYLESVDVLPSIQQPTPPLSPPPSAPPTKERAGMMEEASVGPDCGSPPSCPQKPCLPLVPLPQPEVELSPEQLRVLRSVIAGRNVFFTGSAGTGKSVLLREIVKWYRAAGKRLHVTASTGIAAINIGGTTLHSWAGVRLGKEPAEALVKKLLGKDKYLRKRNRELRKRYHRLPESEDEYASDADHQPRVVERWQKCHALIIDESEGIQSYSR